MEEPSASTGKSKDVLLFAKLSLVAAIIIVVCTGVMAAANVEWRIFEPAQGFVGKWTLLSATFAILFSTVGLGAFVGGRLGAALSYVQKLPRALPWLAAVPAGGLASYLSGTLLALLDPRLREFALFFPAVFVVVVGAGVFAFRGQFRKVQPRRKRKS